MRYFHIIVFTFFVPDLLTSQVFFPLNVGSWWAYTDYTSLTCEGTSIIYDIVADSTLPNGKHYAVFRSMSHLGSRYIRQQGNRVLAFDTSEAIEYTLFDFSAQPGDTLWSGPSRVIVAQGGMEFAQYPNFIRWAIRDSIGVTKFWPGSCSFDLTGGHWTTAVPNDRSPIPTGCVLEQNYPNPFNPTTTITFSLPTEQTVSLVVFNSLGQQVKSLFSGKFQAGVHRIFWNASALSSGTYYYSLSTNGSRITRSAVVLK